jgi:hypothetical protein
MSDRRDTPDENSEPGRGPNLKLMYTLLALALAAAIGLALLIVRPFYLRH